MEQLLPCPFCGGEAALWTDEGTDLRYAGCRVCEAETAQGTAEVAAAAWNRRALPLVVKGGKMITVRTYPTVPQDLQLEIELGAAIVMAQDIAHRLRELGHHEAAKAAIAVATAIVSRETIASPDAATRAVLSVKK